MTLVIANGSVPSSVGVGKEAVKVSASLSLLPGEQEKINSAVEALAGDEHAPRQISLRVGVHIHREYPKDIDGVIVYNEDEEAAALAQKAAEPAE